ncbi:MAG: transcription-repair coupling factor [Thiohalomonadales bacterium]
MNSSNTLTTPPHCVEPGKIQTWGHLYGSSTALNITQVATQHPGLVLVICTDTPSAHRLEESCRFYGAGNEDLPILHFPDWEILPYDSFSPHQDIISQRLTILHRLPKLSSGILILPISTLMQRLANKNYLDSHCFIYRIGETLSIEQIRHRLTTAGYQLVSQVMEHGEFSVRGSIIDLFPMGGKLPYRIELFDDEIESIRLFDPEDQRTVRKVEKIQLLPAREFPLDDQSIAVFRQAYRAHFEGDPQKSSIYRDVSEGLAPAGIENYLPLFFDSCASLFDYLPDNCLLFAIEDIHEAAEAYWKEIGDRYEMFRHDIERPILAPMQIFLPVATVYQQIRQLPFTQCQGFELEPKSGNTNFPCRRPPALTIQGRHAEPAATLKKFLAQFDGRVLFVAESTGRREHLIDVLRGQQIQTNTVKNWAEFIQNDVSPAMCVSRIDLGLLLDNPAIAVITEQQLFGEHVLQQRRQKSRYREPEQVIKNLVELVEGSPVVHEEHGIGRYLGLQKISLGDIDQEFLTIKYAGDDKLYVPVASLHLISRYTGMSADAAPLHKLGSPQWEKSKRKARERILDVAVELLDIYARREAKQGHSYQIDAEQYQVFSASFPFEETPDQRDAIESVVNDMQGTKPMDRLICGDVGFGKTEVAMRATFIAIQDGKQVAMLVPTTLLAQQHYETFIDRFADWPVRVEAMSRFKSKKELVEIEKDLTSGKIDIVIGTHKIIQSSIKFKQLGLVIIDEEHRFGVRQKERFKSIRSEVDLLTLTATPIPRTLNMSMSGLRDFSIIATPPARRLAIRTFVNQWNPTTIREACLREIRRGGQVFFLHNKVDNIDKTAADLRELLPEANIEIAHGQMRERNLEKIMADFYHQRFNILVCTTIIETGIDVPNANTIVMNRADRFGLAQLYQLRGRVGRSHHQAYAYLIVPPRKQMTADAIKRLEVIEAIEDLGAGFTLATHDMEIRGAGEILGDDQSGQLQEIGFNLYIDLLDRAVKELKSGRQPELDKPLDTATEVDFGLSALIPDDYLPDVHARLILYKRISNATNPEALRELQVEMIDRFGLLPDATKNLFNITKIKLLALPFGIKKIEFGSDQGRITFNAEPNIEPIRIIQLIQSQPQKYKLDGQDKLTITKDMPTIEDRMNTLREVIKVLTDCDVS